MHATARVPAIVNVMLVLVLTRTRLACVEAAVYVMQKSACNAARSPAITLLFLHSAKRHIR